ncbi:MAG: hypothetical protein J5691_00795 [Bacilli bacterium]|nr:hypothetical protein [Bacilli bacterium]
MKTDRDFLIEALRTYVDTNVRSCFYWNSLSTYVYITDISELKVRIELSFGISKDKYLKSFRRFAINKLIENLEKDLDIKSKFKTDIKYGETRIIEDTWGSKVNYCDVDVKYLIPRDLYNKLETLIKIDNRAFIKEKSDERIFP